MTENRFPVKVKDSELKTQTKSSGNNLQMKYVKLDVSESHIDLIFINTFAFDTVSDHCSVFLKTLNGIRQLQQQHH